MNFFSKRRIAVFCLVGAVLLLGVLIFQAARIEPGIIEEQVGETHILFTVDRQQVLFPGDCVLASWDIGPVRSVEVNRQGRPGTDDARICTTVENVVQLRADLPDGSARVYYFPIYVLFANLRGWLLVAMPLALLVAAGYFAGLKRPRVTMPRWRISTRVAVVSIGVLYVGWAAVFIERSSFVLSDGSRYFSLFDDAMISMRYAWNLAHGSGLVWNPGERVEGYTNLLMTLYMTVANLLFNKPLAVLSIQISGVVFMLLIAWLTMRAADFLMRKQPSPYRALFNVFCFAAPLCYYPLNYWTLLGMETGMLTVLTLASVVCVLEATHDGLPIYRRLLPVTLGLAYLTRPDAMIIAVVILLYLGYDTYRKTSLRDAVRALVPLVTVYALFPIGQTAFRLVYYGKAVPNTYTLKVEGMATLTALSNGIIYTAAFLQSIALPLGLVLIGILFSPNRMKILLFGLLLALMGYQTYVGGDAWLRWRLVVPAMPLFLALVALELFALVERFKPPMLSVRRVAAGLTTAFVICVGSTSLLIWGGETMENEKVLYQAHRRLVVTALALEAVTTPDATLGVHWGGTLPYYAADRRAIDFLGKADPYIAQLPPDNSGESRYIIMQSRPGHNKFDLYYSIEQLQPTYVQACMLFGDDVCDWVKAHYVQVQYQGERLWLLRDSPAVRWDVLNVDDSDSK